MTGVNGTGLKLMTGVNDTSHKLITGVNGTSHKLITGVNNIGDKLIINVNLGGLLSNDNLSFYLNINLKHCMYDFKILVSLHTTLTAHFYDNPI